MEILTGDIRSRATEPRRRDSMETPAQPVRVGGNRHVRAVRETLAMTLAILVTVVGLGIAGGHLPNGLSGLARATAAASSPSPSIRTAAFESPAASSPAPSTVPAPTPVVTPVVPCSAARATSPDPMLAIAGVGRYEGNTTYLSDLNPGVVEATGGDIDLPITADSVVALVFVDHRCALAWDISFDGGRVLYRQDNPRLDPAFAAQNEFPLSFGARPFSGTLTATLRFATGESRSVWHITVPPYDVPSIALGDAGSPGSQVIAAPGCGMEITFHTGTVFADSCASELPATEIPVLRAKPGALLAFHDIDAAFEPEDGTLRCGHAEGEPPFLESDPTCVLGASPTGDPAQFRVPAAPGTWLISVAGCVTLDGDRACGSWFVIVDTTGAIPTRSPSI